MKFNILTLIFIICSFLSFSDELFQEKVSIYKLVFNELLERNELICGNTIVMKPIENIEFKMRFFDDYLHKKIENNEENMGKFQNIISKEPLIFYKNLYNSAYHSFFDDFIKSNVVTVNIKDAIIATGYKSDLKGECRVSNIYFSDSKDLAIVFISVIHGELDAFSKYIILDKKNNWMIKEIIENGVS